METLITFLAIVSFIIGSCIGSFLNVVIYRLPRNLSVNQPRRSFCPNCNYKIPVYLNIPIISWIILRGKCKNCSAKVSVQYLIVEVITGILFLLCWYIYGLTSSGHLQVTYYLVLPGWIFISLLISASIIDYEHQIIPDSINKIGIIFGLLCALFFPVISKSIMGNGHYLGNISNDRIESVFLSIIGGGIGFLIIYIIVVFGKVVFGKKVLSKTTNCKWRIIEGEENPILLYDDQKIRFEDVFFVGTERLVFDTENFNLNGDLVATSKVTVFFDRIVYDNNSVEIADWVSVEGCGNGITYHREAMGFGDVKYMAMIGVFIGWKGVLFTLFMASIVGTIISLPGKIIKGDNALSRIPFGPFLSIGALIWLFFGPELLEWYINLISIGKS